MSSTTLTPRPFEFEGHAVRTLTFETGLTWWVLSDVAKALEVQNASDLAKRLDQDERSRFNLGRQGEAWIVNESGLYKIVLRSDKPEAKRFQRWVTHDVLPQIRRTGGYIPQAESPSETMARAVLIAQRTIEQQERKLAAQEPKVLFADAVTASDSNILVGVMAKILRQNGVPGMGQNRFFKWLREHGYLSGRKGGDWNMPTQRSADMGLFFVKETPVAHRDGHTSVERTTLVTPKGQMYFVNRFLDPKLKEAA
ncbi:phage antirepressor [Bifidobacterium xylocopae]|uniref:Phage antirepressor Ant n=1 Tax=Bifidobacterium xylocopae TaxID=2493119 RepID=A0A366KF75_9BIFI|nr:phage antirepressor KilAC domain-containing protein [Bifidobacterium xylocopae]RBQ00038.1 phage antirepressor Ant [Bifidobacterium xylocopae]